MRYFVLFFSLLLGGLMVSACGDDSSPGTNQNGNLPDAGPGKDTGTRPDAAQCRDWCQQGDVQCVPGGFQVCGNYDADPCLEWGPVTACDAGEKCVDGKCQTTCVDDCVQSAKRCDPTGTVEGYQVCEQGTDGCWHWSTTTPCGQGETCSAGVCSATCHDECNEGSRQCAGDGFQVCASDHDADPCTEWGPITPCGQGETCSNGQCSASCTNECTQGAKRCDGSSGYQECGDFDQDPCLEWSATIPCNANQVCSNGECTDTCQDECAQAGDTQCTPAGDGYQTCETNAQGCLSWGQVVSCPSGESCQDGHCVTPCTCDFYPGICEPAQPNSTTPCDCDPACSTGQPCTADNHCDTWCPSGVDPDCSSTCTCDTNAYCEAAGPGSSDNCDCDLDCEPHEFACSDDGHCDIYCPTDTDPDCRAENSDPCRDRWRSIGWRFGNELILDGSYDDPDSTEGDPWVLLSPGLSGGSGEIFVFFAAEHADCVDSIRVEVYGYDDSTFGDGAEVLLYNWSTGKFDLLPNTVGSSEDLYDNDVSDASDYMYCGTDHCYVDAKVDASAWDNTHVFSVEVYVHTSSTP